jgi:hypothetical protein
MIRTLKFLIWTGCAMGLGLYVSTLEFDGKPTVELVRRAWKQHAANVDLSALLKAKISGALGEAHDALPAKPKEHHSSEDRDAVNKLIATHGQKG